MFLLMMLFGLVPAGSALAQQVATPPSPPVPQRPVPRPSVSVPRVTVFAVQPVQDTEISSPVTAGVNVNFCINEGTLTINGWDRNELRVFVKQGVPVEINTLKTRAEVPEWVTIKASNKNLTEGVVRSECIAGRQVEIDLPKGSELRIQGRSVHAAIDSVKKVNIRNVSGNISLRNIESEAAATTHQGNIVVENSKGVMNLATTTGNIVAIDVSSSNVGELFRARTNSGAVALKNISHYQIEANTITGSLVFDGTFLDGGIYNFRTSNGSIKLNIPEQSSFKLTAIYGFGKFDSGISFKAAEQSKPGQPGRVAGVMGAGGAEVSLSTNSGSIGIIKRQ